MAAPRRETRWFLLGCLTVLAAAEYTVITVFVLPAPSARIDWIIATGFAAPMATLALVGTPMLIIRTFADVLATLRYIGRCITRILKRSRGTSETPQPPTPSAASPAAPASCSAGWPSAGPSSTSPPGKERIPWP